MTFNYLNNKEKLFFEMASLVFYADSNLAPSRKGPFPSKSAYNFVSQLTIFVSL